MDPIYSFFTYSFPFPSSRDEFLQSVQAKGYEVVNIQTVSHTSSKGGWWYVWESWWYVSAPKVTTTHNYEASIKKVMTEDDKKYLPMLYKYHSTFESGFHWFFWAVLLFVDAIALMLIITLGSGLIGISKGTLEKIPWGSHVVLIADIILTIFVVRWIKSKIKASYEKSIGEQKEFLKPYIEL